MTRFLLLASMCLALSAQAAEVGGVRIDDATQVGNAKLVLNGAGVRKVLFFNAYAMGLYLPKKTATPSEAIAQEGPKRISLHMLRDIGAGRFTDALNDGIRQNHSEADLKSLDARVQTLTATMAAIGEAKKGMTITLDWSGTATLIAIDGKPAGKPIEGADFYRALLRIWLGEKPVQDDLKKALLGGG
jgi:hypothetical protein